MCVCVSSVLERHMLWSDFSVVLRQCKDIEDIVHYYWNFDKHVLTHFVCNDIHCLKWSLVQLSGARAPERF